MDRATTKRLISLTVALIVVLPLSVIAARWQWNRHIERDARNAAVQRAESTDPVALHALLPSGSAAGPETEWRRVTVTGQWAANRQLLVRKQSVNGQVGFVVMTPLDVDVAGSGRERLLVLRGFAPDTADLAALPSVPSGTVTVTLRVRVPSGDGEVRPSDLPPGQINYVNPKAFAAQFDRTWWDGRTPVDAVFEVLAPEQPGLTMLPWPTLSSGPHLSYFVQWILIGCTAVIVYVRVFRSEVRGRREDADGVEA